MNTIRERVQENGYKTDGFVDLKFKAYLITENDVNENYQNSYAPLYLWKSHKGLNTFLLNGYYDNILDSFGWQHIPTSILLLDNTTSSIGSKSFLYQYTGSIEPQPSLRYMERAITSEIPNLEDGQYFITYDPHLWTYTVNYFLAFPVYPMKPNSKIYTILHVSQDKLPHE